MTESIIDMYICPIRPLQIRWSVHHFGTVNLMSFTIIINEYSKIYQRTTCCCRRTQSTCSKVHRPFQKWFHSIETVANEASTYIYIYGVYCVLHNLKHRHSRRNMSGTNFVNVFTMLTNLHYRVLQEWVLKPSGSTVNGFYECCFWLNVWNKACGLKLTFYSTT